MEKWCPSHRSLVVNQSQPKLRPPSTLHLHNHLCNSLSTQRLTTHKLILPQSRNGIEYRRDEEKHRRGDQAGRILDDGQPLYYAHDQVHCSAGVIRRELADKSVKLV